MTSDDPRAVEYDRWRDLTSALVCAGAVTHVDVSERAVAWPETPGRKLLDAILNWGHSAGSWTAVSEKLTDEQLQYLGRFLTEWKRAAATLATGRTP